MNEEQNRRTVLTYYDAYNRRDFETVARCPADDLTAHPVPEELGMGQGPEAFVVWLQGFEAASPDTHLEPLETVADGDIVVVRARGTATHEGEFMGIQATGRKVDIEASDFVRCDEDAKITEFREFSDNLTVLQQLGVIPEEVTP